MISIRTSLLRWAIATLLILGSATALFGQGINVKISSFSRFYFPEIHIFVQVSDAAGNPITGLAESDFEISENGVLVVPDVIPALYSGISYGMALDCSGSMSGYENQVKTACTTFVAYMEPLDQASVIFYESYGDTRVVQPMTNDHSLLNAAILTYYANGGTALWYGYTQALWEVQDEIPPRVMVGFTDGNDNSSQSYTQASTTTLAQAAGAPVYSIGIGGVVAAPLIQIANATRGGYVQTTVDSLWWYYQQIQNAYENQYEAAYYTPDPDPNGLPRHIAVTVTALGSSDSDTISYPAPFVSNFAPQITLTPHTVDTLLAQAQPANQAITVTAWITDNDILTSTLIRHRPIGSTSFNYGVMARVTDSLYAYTFQPGYVTLPGIEFYILANDSYNQATSSPAMFPSLYPYQIAVLPNEKPQITHDPIPVWPVGVPIQITCMVQDVTLNVDRVKLYIQNTSEIFWDELPMVHTVGNAWAGTIPAAVLNPTLNLEYYVRAWDDQETYGTSGPSLIDVGPAPLSVTLTAISPPIQIPAHGGSFNFNVALQNLASSPLPLDAWIMITLPNGSIWGPALGPITLNLPANFTLGRVRTQSVPAVAPPGDYIYALYAGDYPNTIWAGDSLNFTKLTTGDGLLVGSWQNTGEPLDLETVHDAPAQPGELALSVRPNPFNPITVASFELRVPSHVSLRIYDTVGRLVETLVDGWRDAGSHEATFDGSNLASGVYIYRLTAGVFTASGKMVLLK